MRYLNENLIRDSFLRLRQNKRGGKIGLERTSALVCFLAFDALLKRTSITPSLDFNPEVNNGNNNRSRLTREFTRLVQLKNGSEPHYLINLGEVTPGGNPPEKTLLLELSNSVVEKGDDERKNLWISKSPT